MKWIVPFGQVSKEAVIPICSPRSEFAVTLAVSRPEDACVEPRSRSEFYPEAFQKNYPIRNNPVNEKFFPF